MRAVTGVKLPQKTIDIVWRLFDKNGDGALQPDEFILVLKSRSTRGMDRARDTGVSRLGDCMLKCARGHK